MKLSLKGGLVLLAILVLPFIVFAAPDLLDDFNDGVAGEDIEDYDAPFGEYSFTQEMGSLGDAWISFIDCAGTGIAQGGDGKCAVLLGSESGGLGLGYLHYEPTIQSQKWVEFDYKDVTSFGFPRAGVTIIGSTTSHYEDFSIGTSWNHFSYEHSEGIVDVQFQATDHEYLEVDNIILRACEACK